MYQQQPHGVLREDGAFIPEDPANSDWQQYLQWLDAGNEPLPLPHVSSVPEEVSMMQARLVLLQAGLLDQVEAAIAAMTEPPRVASKIRWEFASSVLRNDPLVAELGAALGLNTAQFDQLFITAATL